MSSFISDTQQGFIQGCVVVFLFQLIAALLLITTSYAVLFNFYAALLTLLIASFVSVICCVVS